MCECSNLKADTGSVVKKDHCEKCDGSLKYLGDSVEEGLLYGRLYRSSEASADIVSWVLPELPEGYHVFGARDLKGKNFVKLVAEDQPVFADGKVTYIGEPIFLIVGEDREVIRQIGDAIEIEYDRHEPILDFESRCDPDLEHMVGYHLGCAREKTLEVEERARRVKVEEFRTPMQEHVYLEPQTVKGFVDDQGRVAVEGSMQCPYYVKNAVVNALGLSADEVRVIQAPMGGAFGGKEDFPCSIGCQVALAASILKKPVLLTFDRHEDMMFTTKRHPSLIRYRTSLDGEGRILGMNIEVYFDGGANQGLSSVVLQRALINSIGVYSIPNVSVQGFVVFTNNVPNGAFRGFGAPQSAFALEAHLAHIAREHGVDPLSYKEPYMVTQGSRSLTGGLFRDPVLLPAMVADVKKRRGYAERKARFVEFNRSNSRFRKGVGVSIFLHGCGFTGSGERDLIKSVVRLEKTAEDEVVIRIANVDMGQGLLTTMSKIVGSSLGIDYKDVRFPYPDTACAPDSGPTVASRTIMIVGKILERAALRLKESWRPGEEMVVEECYVHDESAIPWDQERFTGDAYPAYSWGVNMVEVTVDTLTGHIDVDHVDAAYDVGKAIDDRILRGQIDGGVVQSVAWGYMENMQRRDGSILQRTISDYGPPTSMDAPPIDSYLYDNPYENGPMGAKGAGELTFIGGGPALLDAVEDALGAAFHRLPLTPEHILETLEAREEG
ncbi:putative xanthine dehydrogenase subunit D [Pseudodesulfovibrio hydrargyri]|uniref:Putative xanthine dehydrogenase subunit D n=1 Tax=Pseudodesulfovibrio hydrargyri TaxID=2125990 RepID=A0A1J5MY25_9BACT|nr:xanthine dehydrogenase family protein molybdopterin-binding subunit [Pseudodesulfovibrio hydrargyri]OIQ50898.1 putative xanthine dehydrogenase subunit D [Pseudodesulfovibrio hydrargyri]